MKKWLSISFLIAVFSCIGFLFWYNEWKYSLPTPVPKTYVAVNLGENIDITNRFASPKAKPVFLHFFNPDCACSRFNIPHFKSLVSSYGDAVTFAVVVITTDTTYTEQSIRAKFDISTPVLFDTSLATSCGVYSTPQAVLLGAEHKLYYRGNYNRNRYCTDQKTNYAQMAIDSLLANRIPPAFNKYALTAYGCSLEMCKK